VKTKGQLPYIRALKFNEQTAIEFSDIRNEARIAPKSSGESKWALPGNFSIRS